MAIGLNDNIKSESPKHLDERLNNIQTLVDLYNIPSELRYPGMEVWVYDEGFYFMDVDGSGDVSDNNNWTLRPAGSEGAVGLEEWTGENFVTAYNYIGIEEGSSATVYGKIGVRKNDGYNVAMVARFGGNQSDLQLSTNSAKIALRQDLSYSAVELQPGGVKIAGSAGSGPSANACYHITSGLTSNRNFLYPNGNIDMTGGVDGDVLTKQADGSLALETPTSATPTLSDVLLQDNLLVNSEQIEFSEEGSGYIINFGGIYSENQGYLITVGDGFGFEVEDFLNGNILSATYSTGLFLSNGDFEAGQVSGGVILASPNGTRYRITVDNAGTLQTALA